MKLVEIAKGVSVNPKCVVFVSDDKDSPSVTIMMIGGTNIESGYNYSKTIKLLRVKSK